MNELTQKQKQIYDHIKESIRSQGYPPSVREICKEMNLKSTSTVHMHLAALEKKGYIKKTPLKNRSIEILEKNFYQPSGEFATVPIVGKVTAGVPVLAVENIEDTFPIPMSYVRGKEVFMLKVSGDSMIDAGIYDKDLVLVQRQSGADNGDIVVALLEDSATVKRFFRRKKSIVLQPENPIYEPIIVKEVIIIGKVIGLFRTL